MYRHVNGVRSKATLGAGGDGLRFRLPFADDCERVTGASLGLNDANNVEMWG